MRRPAPAPRFLVLRGGVDGVCPSPLAEDVVLARCLVGLGDSAWTQIEQAGAPERLVNCRALPAGGYVYDNPKLGALRIVYNPNQASLSNVPSGLTIYMAQAGNPGETEVSFGLPMLQLDPSQGYDLRSMLASMDEDLGASLVAFRCPDAGEGQIMASTVQQALTELAMTLAQEKTDRTSQDALLRGELHATTGATLVGIPPLTNWSSASPPSTVWAALQSVCGAFLGQHANDGKHSRLVQELPVSDNIANDTMQLLWESGFSGTNTKLRLYAKAGTMGASKGVSGLVATVNAQYRPYFHNAGTTGGLSVTIEAGYHPDNLNYFGYALDLFPEAKLLQLTPASTITFAYQAAMEERELVEYSLSQGLTTQGGLRLGGSTGPTITSGPDAPPTMDAPIGSIYLSTMGVLYQKINPGSGNGTWVAR